MLLFNQAYQKRKFTFFKFQEESTKKKTLKDKIIYIETHIIKVH